MVGERGVLPGGAARTSDDLEPGGLAKLGVLAAVVDRMKRALGEVADREVRDRVAPRLEEQDRVVALHHRLPAELGAHPAPQRLGVQDPLRHPGYEELPVGVAA